MLAASQIAKALSDHEGHVTAVVPHYAMSGGTLISMAADEIVMDGHAALGPVDPQLGQYPAASILAALEAPGDHKDETLFSVTSHGRQYARSRCSPGAFWRRAWARTGPRTSQR